MPLDEALACVFDGMAAATAQTTRGIHHPRAQAGVYAVLSVGEIQKAHMGGVGGVSKARCDLCKGVSER